MRWIIKVEEKTGPGLTSPIYQNPDGTWPVVPDGLIAAEHVSKSGKNLIKIIGHTEVVNRDETIVWIMGHECFHFLRRTKQVPGRNHEIDADAFADELLKKYRADQ